MIPILYTFRRCPYAMRARMALHASGIDVAFREVLLRDKPACMLLASPKGTVPVLIQPDGRVIDESWDIMQWALQQQDPENWLGTDQTYALAAQPLIANNDQYFKPYLDRYKYADRYPAQSRLSYRMQAEIHLSPLESRLCYSPYLLGDTLSIADAALFPFIRQFAKVDQDWFAQAPYPALRDWLNGISNSPRFAAIMQKQTPFR
ncbi:MAG: glutathione S-transferase [Gallionella sp.]